MPPGTGNQEKYQERGIIMANSRQKDTNLFFYISFPTQVGPPRCTKIVGAQKMTKNFWIGSEPPPLMKNTLEAKVVVFLLWERP